MRLHAGIATHRHCSTVGVYISALPVLIFSGDGQISWQALSCESDGARSEGIDCISDLHTMRDGKARHEAETAMALKASQDKATPPLNFQGSPGCSDGVMRHSARTVCKPEQPAGTVSAAVHGVHHPWRTSEIGKRKRGGTKGGNLLQYSLRLKGLPPTYTPKSYQVWRLLHDMLQRASAVPVRHRELPRFRRPPVLRLHLRGE